MLTPAVKSGVGLSLKEIQRARHRRVLQAGNFTTLGELTYIWKSIPARKSPVNISVVRRRGLGVDGNEQHEDAVS